MFWKVRTNRIIGNITFHCHPNLSSIARKELGSTIIPILLERKLDTQRLPMTPSMLLGKYQSIKMSNINIQGLIDLIPSLESLREILHLGSKILCPKAARNTKLSIILSFPRVVKNMILLAEESSPSVDFSYLLLSKNCNIDN